jgi:hypothetical protein
MLDFDAAQLRSVLKKMSEKEKDTLLLRSVRRDAEWRATLAYELLPEVNRDTVYEAVSEKIHTLLMTASGYQLARMLVSIFKKATEEINFARRITGERTLEIDLYAYLLREVFTHYSGQLDSHYTPFYKAVAKLVVKLIKLIKRHLHEDLWLDYNAEITDWLQQLRRRNNFWELSFELPTSIA